MLATSLTDQVIAKDDSLQSAIDKVWLHPQVRAELRELFFDVLTDAPDHVQHAPLPTVPLQLHSQYTRIEILAAMGEGTNAKTPPWREAYTRRSAPAPTSSLSPLIRRVASSRPLPGTATTRSVRHSSTGRASPAPPKTVVLAFATAPTHKSVTLSCSSRAGSKKRSGLLVPWARYIRVT